MKKCLAVLLAFGLGFNVAARCLASAPSEVIVFAAASLTESLTEIGARFMEKNPEVALVFNFDSSGTLKTQIEEGATCDLFLSAARKQMDELDVSSDQRKDPDDMGSIDPNSRLDLLANQVVLIVPEGNPAEVHSFAELAERLRTGDILFAMGNKDVPVGQYTQKLLGYFGVDEDAADHSGAITYGSSVKEVTTQIKEGLADCAVVYQTDAFAAELEIVDAALEEMRGEVVYPAAMLLEAPHAEEASLFFEYLCGEEAREIFEKLGFTFLPVDKN